MGYPQREPGKREMMKEAKEIVLRALFEKWDELEQADEIHLDASSNHPKVQSGYAKERGSWVA
jgi:hypothetical protein